jgi:3-dehydroquinate dehydratase-2
MGREPHELNGRLSLEEIENSLTGISNDMKVELDFFQSNIEGELVNKIHDSKGIYDGILIHLGAFSFTSIAIADAINNIHIPTIELMMNNISHTNDQKRKNSVVLPSCLGLITGFGPFVYQLGLIAIHNAIIEISMFEEEMRKKQMKENDYQ